MKSRLSLIWRNLWRNRRRTWITMSSVMFALVLSIVLHAIQTGTFEKLISNLTGYYTGYLQVHAAGYQEQPTLEHIFKPDPLLQKKIQSMPGVNGLAPRLEAPVLVSAGDITRGAQLAGIDPAQEQEVTNLRSRITEGTYLDSAFSEKVPPVLVGTTLAERLKLRVGDTVVMLAQGFHGATAAGLFRIGGLLEFGAPMLNERILYARLKDMQHFLDAPDLLSSWVVRTRGLRDVAVLHTALRSQLPQSMEVVSWEEMLPDIKNHLDADRRSFRLISLVLYGIIAFGILGTLIMMLNERRYELGLLQALGMTGSKMAWMLFTELVFLIAGGILIGSLLAIPISWWLQVQPIQLEGELARMYRKYGFEPVMPSVLRVSIIWNEIKMIVYITLLLSLYPVWKSFRLNALTAMHSR